MKKYLTLLATTSVSLLACGSIVAADPVEDFYKSRDITLVVPFAPGGSTALQAQAAAKYFTQYLPGNPRVIPQFMPGAGGMLAVNHTYNSSPRDGSVIIYAQDSNVIEQYLNEDTAKYDVRKLNWLGSVVEFEYTLGIDKSTSVESVDDLKKKEVFVASTGIGSASHIFPSLTNALLGTKMKVVGGYTGGAPAIYLALERKETQGYVTQYWHSRPVFENCNPILTFGPERSRVFPNVPTLLEHVKDPKDRPVVQFAGLIGTLGRGFATMPDVPQDRVAALRKAFDQMAANPAFIAEVRATGTGEEVRKTPLSGEEFQKRIAAGMDIGPDVIARLKTILAER